MRLLIARDSEALAHVAADWIQERARPGSLLGLAVGGSVTGAYRELAARPGSLAGVMGITIDELHPLAAGDPRAFAALLADWLGAATGVVLEPFDLTANNPDAEAQRMETFTRSRPFTACVLGIGPNGHLALNEPGVPFDAPSRFVPFIPGTLAHLGGTEAVAPATGGMSLSIAALLSAESILLVVDGAKEDALRSLLWGPLTPDLPASALRFHPDATVLTTHALVGAELAALRAVPGVTLVDPTEGSSLVDVSSTR